MKTYITVQGDKWDDIAYRMYGDVNYTDKLINANMRYRDVYIFSSGVSLDIPELSAPSFDDLPPWKRVNG